MPKKLTRLRKSAFVRQNGLCHYCQRPMWVGSPERFLEEHKITSRRAKFFQCTAEHLEARQDGGEDTPGNIVAACAYCNRHRHARRNELSREEFAALVKRRLIQARWHTWVPA
jgi:hypothetical protein